MTADLLDKLRSQPVTDVDTAARLLDRSRATGYRLAASGELPGVRRLGSRYVVVTSELLAWLGLNEDAPTATNGEGVDADRRQGTEGALHD